jgi:ribose transport system permease protein
MSVDQTKAETTVPAQPRKQWELQRFALLAAWAALLIVFSVLMPTTFMNTANFTNILGSQAVLLVIALALLTPLRAGDYDLSAASVLTLSAMTVAVANVQWGLNVWLCVLLGLGVGAFIGCLNGWIVVTFGIDPFIVTLGMGTVATGVVYGISDSQTITGLSTGLSDSVVQRSVLDLPNVFFYALALCVLLWYVFEFTPVGQRLLFVGQNREMARLNGVNVEAVRWGALTVSGLLAGLAGVFYSATLGGADPTSGASFLLPAFAACFLGSTAFRIGRFNPWGTFVAVYFLITGITGLQLLGAQNYVQQLFYGGALVLAVVLSRLVRRRQTRG